jgi:hypothetical protein
MPHLEITIKVSIEILLDAEDSELNLVADRVRVLYWWNIGATSRGGDQWISRGSFPREIKMKMGQLPRSTGQEERRGMPL